MTAEEKYKGMTFRDLLIRTVTLVECLVEKEIPDLKKEDQRLEERIDRVSSTYKYITAGFLALTAIGGVLAAVFG